jgi:O-antigen/teichoic acid export membrane protein
MALRDTPLPVMAGLVAGAASAGLLQFATRIALTMASIDEVVGRIAFPAFSRLQGRPHEQARALDAAILLTALVMVPVQCLLAALAPVVVPAVFGAGWVPAILPLQLICVAALFRFPARYLRQTVFAEGASGRGLAIAAVCLVLAVGSFVPALLLLGLAGTGLGFLVGAVLGMTATAWLSRPFVRLDWRPFGRLVSAGLLAGASALLAMQMSRGWLAGSQVGGTLLVDWISVILSTMLFALLFGGLTWLLESRLLRLGIRLARQAARY